MDREYNNESDLGQSQGQEGGGEIVEFHSEMPQVPDDQVEFIPDEHLEEEIQEEI